MKLWVPGLAAIVAFASMALPILSAQAAPEVARGQTLFNQRCGTCHAAAAGQVKPMGPNLFGVMGRKAGTLPGFRFSAAMKASNITWDTATLAAYLEAPARKVPGTSMMIGVPQVRDRDDIVAYLKTLH